MKLAHFSSSSVDSHHWHHCAACQSPSSPDNLLWLAFVANAAVLLLHAQPAWRAAAKRPRKLIKINGQRSIKSSCFVFRGPGNAKCQSRTVSMCSASLLALHIMLYSPNPAGRLILTLLPSDDPIVTCPSRGGLVT